MCNVKPFFSGNYDLKYSYGNGSTYRTKNDKS